MFFSFCNGEVSKDFYGRRKEKQQSTFHLSINKYFFLQQFVFKNLCENLKNAGSKLYFIEIEDGMKYSFLCGLYKIFWLGNISIMSKYVRKYTNSGIIDYFIFSMYLSRFISFLCKTRVLNYIYNISLIFRSTKQACYLMRIYVRRYCYCCNISKGDQSKNVSDDFVHTFVHHLNWTERRLSMSRGKNDFFVWKFDCFFV